MKTAIASHGELDGVQWAPATRECLVQWGYFNGQLVGRQPHGKATLLHYETDELLDELLAACKSEIVIIAEGALAELGVDESECPTISGGSLAGEVLGAQAATKTATGAAAGKAVSELSAKNRTKALELAGSVKATAIAEQLPEGELAGGRII